ncbi:MAG: PTS transporter subunit EIIB [Rhodocyclaceae bacterium]|nr:PTS transporter subunit EIIB [Rhodocyclaceae bacterium]
MFLAFPLYAVYAALYGIFAAISVALGFRAGFCFSAGLTDLVFSASLPAAARTWLILPLGIAAAVVFYGVFRFAIVKWDLKTPGREEGGEDEWAKTGEDEPGKDGLAAMAAAILAGCGGRENIASVDHCITRLRLEVKDERLVDEARIKKSGCAGVIRPGKGSVQVVIGPKVQFVCEAFRKLAE